MTSPRSLRRIGSPAHWVRSFGRAPRIIGLDIARALAILGMIGAHVGEVTDIDLLNPATWLAVVHGNSSVLFAVLAGISVTLLTGRIRGADPHTVLKIRLSMVGRGAAIFAVGVALEATGTGVSVILALYGVLYIAIIPFLTWRTSRLAIAAAAFTVLGPVALAALTLRGPAEGEGISLVLEGTYPLTVWMALVLGGMVVGRLRPDRTKVAWILLGAGTAMCAIGSNLSTALLDLLPLSKKGESTPLTEMLVALTTAAPHSGGTLEIISSGGFALAIIGACVLLSRRLRWPLLPLAAIGSMPLTAYSAHVLVILAVSGPGSIAISNVLWAWMAIGLTLAATLWSIFFGRGPLERFVGWSARSMSTARCAPAIDALDGADDASPTDRPKELVNTP